MELRLVRVWHQPTGCILRLPSFLIPYSLKRDSIPQRVADSIHGIAVIKYESEEDNYGKKELAFRVQRRISS